MLGGESATLYDDIDDLVSLHLTESDRLTGFMQDHFGFLFREKQRHGIPDNPLVGRASGERLSNFISYLSTILAATLMMGAILVLYKTKSDDLKLGLVGLFTVVFAGSVGLLTNAKRSEVFGATAA
ncbi:hypothetical protein Ct61P_01612 [Colletotrichum tofieldiae]|nr:hypothetical protein Ct61P_01612 [Colletotrichum tofieldiae]